MFKMKGNNFAEASVFCMAAALFFSNLFGEHYQIYAGVRLLNLLSVLSFFVALPVARSIDFFRVFVVFFIVVMSSLWSILDVRYWVNIVYKAIGFFPVFVVVRVLPIKRIYGVSLVVFVLSSVLALLSLFLGLNAFRYILYDDHIPRFAGFAIEPSGYALGVMALYSLSVMSEGKGGGKSVLYSLPIIVAISSSIILKFLMDTLIFVKKKYLLIVLPLVVLLLFVVSLYSRIGESVLVRIDLYLDQLRVIDISFWGKGIYLAEADALPGVVRFWLEIGPIGFFCLFFMWCYVAIRLRLFKCPYLLLVMVLPLILEAYMAPFVWIGPVYIIMQGIKGGRVSWLDSYDKGFCVG